jgi:hypothetical protein
MKRLRLAFEIVDIRGFKKLGRTGNYLVQYKPRILDADDEFLFEFSEVRGRPWPLTDLISQKLSNCIFDEKYTIFRFLVTSELTQNGWK